MMLGVIAVLSLCLFLVVLVMYFRQGRAITRLQKDPEKARTLSQRGLEYEWEIAYNPGSDTWHPRLWLKGYGSPEASHSPPQDDQGMSYQAAVDWLNVTFDEMRETYDPSRVPNNGRTQGRVKIPR